jgi:hypothetical protein
VIDGAALTLGVLHCADGISGYELDIVELFHIAVLDVLDDIQHHNIFL